ncbi:trigger factor [Brucella cytisi]|uniref:trigger factor n=1 Tax=Brucella cytisi TaxID=407152 RepID=UPI0019816987|nr:trigger factor [Brucella cytisi]
MDGVLGGTGEDGGLGGSLGGTIGGVVGSLDGVLGGAGEDGGLGGSLGGTIGGVVGSLDGVLGGTGEDGGLGGSLGGTIGGVVGSLDGVLGGTGEDGGFGGIGGTIGGVVGSLDGVLGGTGEDGGLGGSLGGTIGGVVGSLDGVLGGTGEDGGLGGSLGGTIGGVVDGLGGTVGGVVSGVTNSLDGALSGLFGGGNTGGGNTGGGNTGGGNTGGGDTGGGNTGGGNTGGGNTGGGNTGGGNTGGDNTGGGNAGGIDTGGGIIVGDIINPSMMDDMNCGSALDCVSPSIGLVTTANREPNKVFVNDAGPPAKPKSEAAYSLAGADGGVSPISLLAFASDSRSEGANDSLPNEIDTNSSGGNRLTSGNRSNGVGSLPGVGRDITSIEILDETSNPEFEGSVTDATNKAREAGIENLLAYLSRNSRSGFHDQSTDTGKVSAPLSSPGLEPAIAQEASPNRLPGLNGANSSNNSTPGLETTTSEAVVGPTDAHNEGKKGSQSPSASTTGENNAVEASGSGFEELLAYLSDSNGSKTSNSIVNAPNETNAATPGELISVEGAANNDSRNSPIDKTAHETPAGFPGSKNADENHDRTTEPAGNIAATDDGFQVETQMVPIPSDRPTNSASGASGSETGGIRSGFKKLLANLFGADAESGDDRRAASNESAGTGSPMGKAPGTSPLANDRLAASNESAGTGSPTGGAPGTSSLANDRLAASNESAGMGAPTKMAPGNGMLANESIAGASDGQQARDKSLSANDGSSRQQLAFAADSIPRDRSTGLAGNRNEALGGSIAAFCSTVGNSLANTNTMNSSTDSLAYNAGGQRSAPNVSVGVAVRSIEMKDLEKIKVTRLVYDVPKSEVDEQVEHVAEATRAYKSKKGKASIGDRITVNLNGKISEVVPAGVGSERTLVLGENELIPGFEEQLVGAKAGDEKMITVEFPKTFRYSGLAGKEASFNVTIKEVASPGKLSVNDETARKIGVKSLADLRNGVRARIENQYGAVAQHRMKEQLLEQLVASYQFTAPPQMVETEFNNIWTGINRNLKTKGTTFTELGTTEEKVRNETRLLAERRIRSGLILVAIGQQAGITVTKEDLKRRLQEQIGALPTGKRQNIINFYSSNPRAVSALKYRLYEEKVVNYLLGRISITDKKAGKEEFLAINGINKSTSRQVPEKN